MRVARFGPGTVELDMAADPCPGPGEAVVEVLYSALCGSDKRLLRSGSASIPGHEIVGRVLELGEGDSPVSVGDAVAVYALLSCGSCEWCAKGFDNRCPKMGGLIGWQVDGGFAERVLVPLRNLIAVPLDVPLQQAVLALDTLGTAAHGLDRVTTPDAASEGPVLVLGCGPLGLGVVAAARARGLEVVAHDIDAGRVAAAAELGASALEPGIAELVDSARLGGGASRSFPLVVEASGAASAKATASELVGQGGSVVMLGEGDQPWTLSATVHWRRTEASWIRSFYFSRSRTEENWELVRVMGAQLERLLLSYAPFSQLPQVASEFLAGRVTKPVFVMTDA